jgi:glycosyltransferase involved in cell wall biosynthesis
MKPKLSICILTFNRIKQLQEELDSILSQVIANNSIEILISDDASTDNTEEIIHHYMERFDYIRYIRNAKNIGLDRNLISCIQYASGDYVSLFSDDDIVLPGTFDCILDLINQHDPSIICSSHYAFEGNNYLTKRRVFFPKKNKIFNNGLEFFLYAGLGFLPSLTLKTEYAKEFIDCVRVGKWSAHLDIASRIALKKPGPFIFLGTHPIAGRVPSIATYDLIVNGFINVNQLYHELEKEGLLSHKIVSKREKSLLKSNIPRTILNQLVMGNYERIYKQKELIRKELGSRWQFYLYVYPLFFIPRQFLIIPYRILRRLIKLYRVYKYN